MSKGIGSILSLGANLLGAFVPGLQWLGPVVSVAAGGAEGGLKGAVMGGLGSVGGGALGKALGGLGHVAGGATGTLGEAAGDAIGRGASTLGGDVLSDAVTILGKSAVPGITSGLGAAAGGAPWFSRSDIDQSGKDPAWLQGAHLGPTSTLGGFGQDLVKHALGALTDHSHGGSHPSPSLSVSAAGPAGPGGGIGAPSTGISGSAAPQIFPWVQDQAAT